MTTVNLKTIIVGCGNIAGDFDVNQNGLPVTHAGAYKHHGKFDIVACVDPNRFKLQKFAKRWKIKNKFLNMKEVRASKLDFDVVSICSPVSSHHKDVFEALKLKPKLIFCEKPLANKYNDAVDIKNMCNKAGVLLAVNYSRRWDPKVVELKNDIAAKKLGEVRSIIGYYNKGIFNNGSHMIDLLTYLFGSLKIEKATSAVNDYFDDDPTITALLNTNSGVPVHLVGTNALDYSLFELEIIGSKKTKTMRDGGLSWSTRNIAKNLRFKGYSKLEKDQYFKGEYLKSMLFAVKNIYNAIIKGHQLSCTGEEACEAHKICFDLFKITSLSNSRKKV